MKQGNTLLYIVIGIVALAVIAFLVMQNRQTVEETTDEVAESVEQTADRAEDAITEDQDTDSMRENEDGVMVGGAMMTPDQDMVENISSSSDHTTLVSAVQAAELVETLRQQGPYTVFAPTNAAFDKLPEGTVDTLLQPENQGQLTGILTYHVVQGEYTSEDLTDGMELETVNGETLTFTMQDGEWWINESAMITTADVTSSNGVTHVIDTVLTPPSAN